MEEKIRLNKYLSEAGVCSRREADRLIEEGKVEVNKVIATMGMKISRSDEVTIKGRVVRPVEKRVLYLMNKPRGIICTTQRKERPNIMDLVKIPMRVYPVGRLDKESEGLILLTNNGDLVNRIMRAGNFHEKEYIVRVNKPVTRRFVKRMSEGIPILDTVTRPCKVEKLDGETFRIILTQGMNRQIRRMCEYLGYQVMELRRVRIMNIQLGDLEEGQMRPVRSEEMEELEKLLKDSDSRPWKEKQGDLQEAEE